MNLGKLVLNYDGVDIISGQGLVAEGREEM